MRPVTVALTALALGTLGGACGDDGGGGPGGESSSDESQEYVDAIVAANDDDEAVTAEDMECYGRSLVDAVGVDVLQGAGITPEEMSDSDSLNNFGITFSDAQADALWSDLNECMDVRAFFYRALADGGEVSNETVACLDNTIDDDLIKRFIIGAVTEGDDAFQEDDQLTRDLAAAFSECPGASPEN